eukprot:4645179-Amphidinium_carterae.1
MLTSIFHPGFATSTTDHRGSGLGDINVVAVVVARKAIYVAVHAAIITFIVTAIRPMTLHLLATTG